MKINSINNNENQTNFYAITKWKVRGKDIRQLPEEVELIKSYVRRIENHPYYQGKDMVATIRSRDYQYFPDMFVTRINPEIDNVPRYSIQIDMTEQAQTVPQKINKFFKNVKEFFVPNNQQAADDIQSYSMVSGGMTMDTAIYSLLGRLRGGEIPNNLTNCKYIYKIYR